MIQYNPPCAAIYCQIHTSLPEIDDDFRGTWESVDENQDSLPQFEGDYYGAYSEDDLDWPDTPHHALEPDELPDEEETEQAADDAELERGWEPERIADSDIEEDGDDMVVEDPAEPVETTPRSSPAPAVPTNSPGRFASQRPVVVQFPHGCAGKPIHRDSSHAFQVYQAKITGYDASPESIWAPFTSRLDYEVARWAKLRGSGSTAFTDLLQIEGVPEALGLSYRNSRELNAIIDHHLPGRPRFQRKEIVVAGEALDLYFRSILECVNALYSRDQRG
ncbi:hypothetical protein HYDPIDRAFT_34518 [Hydnomerulius pinastri MD-312]|uniref:Unplaced genomic scaffold scaffold_161, whole genome shotgun sequence n=1 Tax=Hydnomerulius pinastri MD-312 TaxID=994086 RepID=A0A0C9W5Z0_9AGAM|nr:hypothetical protein HYDPIDRAFT_34518 [Hydnomerulius pinastri MD-312]